MLHDGVLSSVLGRDCLGLVVLRLTTGGLSDITRLSVLFKSAAEARDSFDSLLEAELSSPSNIGESSEGSVLITTSMLIVGPTSESVAVVL